MPRRVILAAVLLALGCGQQRSPAPDVSVAVASPALENSGEPASSGVVTPQPEAGKPAAPPPVFAYPTDLAGQALPRVVTPAAPPMPPTERFGLAPKGRTPPARLLDPEPVVKTAYTPTPLMLPRAIGLKPVAPAERVPIDLGTGADAVPGKPALPEAPGVNQKAPDVNQPPALPPLGRPVPDRAALDDPTAETGNAAIVGRSVAPAPAPAGFVKLGLPDPFELGDQVRPRVPPAAEPGVAPIPVNPERAK
ncbi:MAG TPA: hypothetical protein VKE74_05615 [Gemmataceae bacterium]|nr:hypothetical protein [Gemmataceae bacterium]